VGTNLQALKNMQNKGGKNTKLPFSLLKTL